MRGARGPPGSAGHGTKPNHGTHGHGPAKPQKEAVSKKTSGLGKLMSALHKNAESLVTTKAEHNGPDQVLASTEHTSSVRNHPVIIRKETVGLGAEEPLSVPSLLHQISEAYPEVTAMKSRNIVTGEWSSWTYEKLANDVQITSRALIETGLHRHHCVVIIGMYNCPLWVISHLAAISAGGIAAGISGELSGEDIARVCIDCKADIIMVQNEQILKKILLIHHKLPQLKTIVQYTGLPPLSDQRRLHKSHGKHILSWEELSEIGKVLPDNKLDERLRRVSINQCCVVSYTSGVSQGGPRAAMFSHDNLTWSAKMMQGFIRSPGFNRPPAPGEEVVLSLFPLSHVSNLMLDVYYILSVAGTCVFPGYDVIKLNKDKELWELFNEIKPTLLYGNQTIYEKIYHRLVTLYQEKTGVQKLLIDWSNSTVREGAGTPESQRKLGAIPQKVAKSTVIKKFKENLGFSGKTTFFCRGQALPQKLSDFLAGFDILVHSAYGQTECSSVLTANVPGRFCKFSTAGKTAPGVKMKLEPQKGSEDGVGRREVCGFGRNIFMGYLNRDNDTKEIMTDDHWLRLRDIGHLDEEGYLNVIGRCSDTVKIDTEEQVFVTPMEQRVRLELACVSQCVVVTSPARDSLGLILTLDTIADANNTLNLSQSAVNWFKNARFEVKTVTDVVSNMENGIKHVIQAGIDRYNLSTVDQRHCILEWELKHLPFSHANGEIGLNGKINRSVITTRYSAQIERMFNKQFTVRKPSRELTYIKEEEEEKLPEIKVTKERKEVRKEEANDNLDDSKETEDDLNKKMITIVNLEPDQQEDADKNLGDKDVGDEKDDVEVKDNHDEVIVTKEHHDKHVRFTSKVEEIDFKESEESYEKTS